MEYEANYLRNKTVLLLCQVELVVLVALLAEYFLGLEDARRQAIAMHEAILARARPNQLSSRYLNLLQVSHLPDGVGAEDLQEFGEGGLWQSFYVVSPTENRPTPLA